MSEQSQLDRMRIFRALAVEKRLEIVQLLAKRTFCVGALANRLGVSAGAVSQHLRILKDAGLVETDRHGYFIHYSLTPDAAERCRAAMDSLFETRKATRKKCRKFTAKKKKHKKPKELKNETGKRPFDKKKISTADSNDYQETVAVDKPSPGE